MLFQFAYYLWAKNLVFATFTIADNERLGARDILLRACGVKDDPTEMRFSTPLSAAVSRHACIMLGSASYAADYHIRKAKRKADSVVAFSASYIYNH